MSDVPPTIPGPEQPSTLPAPGPWGLGATIGFSLVIVCAYFGAQVAVVIGFVIEQVVADGGKVDLPALEALGENGAVLAWANLLSALLCVPLILLFARMRKRITLARYLHLGLPRWWQLPLWIALLYAVFTPLEWARVEIFDLPVVPAFMIEAYRTAGYGPLFWVAIVIAAPLTEEFFFRGFLFEGLRHSRLGAIGAVLLASVAFAAIHFQYGFLDTAVVFLGGIFLGLARLHTGSLWTAVILHGAWNMTATIQTAQIVAEAG